MKIVSIVGARPQFIKAAPVSKALRERHEEILVHTGQHYDAEMSQVFFDELNIPEPEINLDVGSASHGRQTADMLIGIEIVLQKLKPDLTLVYGDTNSTLAGALAAAKMHIKTAHVEAGLRSFVRTMPEEINRVVADRLSDLLFCPTAAAVENLENEGIRDNVHNVGDVMYDAVLTFEEIARSKSRVLENTGLTSKSYHLVTCHRAHNTDDKMRLERIVNALIRCNESIVFPVHPRTRKCLKEYGLEERLNAADNVRLLGPVSYLDMITLEKNAAKILTDSGGVQKEAYFLKVPCITMREETEWVETVEDGWNMLVGADEERIIDAVQHFEPPHAQLAHYGDGNASAKIVDVLENSAFI